MTAAASKTWIQWLRRQRGAPPEKEDLTLCCFLEDLIRENSGYFDGVRVAGKTNLRRNTCEHNITTLKNIGSEPAGS
jgi:hypothetical protein